MTGHAREGLQEAQPTIAAAQGRYRALLCTRLRWTLAASPSYTVRIVQPTHCQVMLLQCHRADAIVGTPCEPFKLKLRGRVVWRGAGRIANRWVDRPNIHHPTEESCAAVMSSTDLAFRSSVLAGAARARANTQSVTPTSTAHCHSSRPCGPHVLESLVIELVHACATGAV